MTTSEIPISKINWESRIRGDATSSKGLKDLSDSINKIGLLNPITVNKDYKLIAGYRRLTACRQLGWSKILANIINVDAPTEILIELEENMKRNNLSKSEQAKGLALFKRAYEEAHPETKHGANIKEGIKGTSRKISDSLDGEPAPRYTKVAAEELDVSERKVQDLVSTGEDILEEEMEMDGESSIAKELDEPKPRKPRVISSDIYRKDNCPYCKHKVGITKEYNLVLMEEDR